jgi:hypothetical protein
LALAGGHPAEDPMMETAYQPLALLRGRTDRVARAARLTAAVLCEPRGETLREATRAAIARARRPFSVADAGSFNLRHFLPPEFSPRAFGFDASAANLQLGLMAVRSMRMLRGR